jgi:hypothetical protein
MREEVPGLVEDLDAEVPVRNADVHVEPEDEQLTDDVLHLLEQQPVPLAVGDLLVGPVRDGVRPGRGQSEVRLGEQRGERPPQPHDLLPGLGHVLAHAGGDLDDRLHHLRPELVQGRGGGPGDEGDNVRPQLARLVDDLELLFDADGQPAVAHRSPVDVRLVPRLESYARPSTT